jgi:hypothetical protein
MDHLPAHSLRRCVERYQGHYRVKRFSCIDQCRCMAFAQLTYRESLRDIEVCLRTQQSKLYHMGIRAPVARNTLANANQVRDWRIHADFAQALIHTARQLYVDDDFGALPQPVDPAPARTTGILYRTQSTFFTPKTGHHLCRIQ